MSEGLYKALGVSKAASDDEIQRAYRRLAKKHHPDANPGDTSAEEQFKRVSAAYAILKDKDLRQRYDRGEIDDHGNERVHMGGFRQHGNDAFEFRAGSGGFGGFDDILSDLFGGLGGGFGGTAGRGQARHGQAGRGQSARRGADVSGKASIDLVTAARGGRERIKLAEGNEIEVNIPAGIESGKQLRLRGKGRPGHGGAPAGDLLIEIEVRPHPTLRREDLDIVIDQPVPLATAVLGGKLRVPTLDGEVALSVPPWSSSGKTLRLRGRGIDDKGQSRKGDQLVRLLITLPDDRDPALEALLQSSRAEV